MSMPAPRACHAPRVARTLAYAACVAFAAFVTLTWVLCALANDFASYGADPAQTSSHFALPTALAAALGLLLALAACALAALARVRDARGDRLGFTTGETCVVAAALTCVVWAAQLLFVRLVYFEPGWDAGTMLEYARWRVSGLSEPDFFGASGNAWVTNYLSVYPNNAPLTWVFVQLTSLAQSWGTDGTFLCALPGAFSVGLAGFACCMAVRLLFGSFGLSMAALALHAALFALSPWVAVPYSDTYASGFVALALLAGVALAGQRVRKPAARGGLWLALGVAAMLGSLVKPTALLVVPVALVVCAVRALAAREPARRMLATCAFAAGGLVLAAMLAFGAAKPACLSALGVDGSPDTALGITHFLMMGQNDETAGSFSQADVDFSRSITSPQERSAAELRVAWERACDRGLLQTPVFYARKLLSSFADGTFNWGYEGGSSFIAHVKADPGGCTYALRSLYYGPATFPGTSRTAFQTAAQVMWFATLALMAAGGCWLAVRCRPGAASARMPLHDVLPRLVAPCALLALALYLLVFECRARYLYCYGSVIVACAASGAWACTGWLARRMRYHRRDSYRQATARAPLGRRASSHRGKGDTCQSAPAAMRPRLQARAASSSRAAPASSAATRASSC